MSPCYLGLFHHISEVYSFHCCAFMVFVSTGYRKRKMILSLVNFESRMDVTLKI